MAFKKAILPQSPESRRVRQAAWMFFITTVLLAQAGFGQAPLESSRSEKPPSFISLGIEGYQKILSPVLNSNCYMLPSCSEYSKQALAEYGPWLGLLMTVDRLFHEANEDRTSPRVRKGDQLKLFDPPSANVWWK